MLIIAVLEFKVQKHAPRSNQVGQHCCTNIAQSILIQGSPRGVGGPEKNGLKDVSFCLVARV